ncbi:hypothetical protein VitviT2T_029123 [Vitis vinifera]|uniref:Reverse transcriptase Ty1/copia-type domain-containing protein n=1 Tax=Vitis vinifera TaxID=29760 RepID=A0ABY9DV80_VITVI|nr:hypothetical protein VitviT2T_029123 [Vitis vinifera]
MVVTGNDLEEKKALQNYLSREFEMKDLGPLKYFIGIEVSRSSEGFFLSQRKYALDLLQETGMSGCQPVNTPIEEGLKLCVEPNQVSTATHYRSLVGALQYITLTRPEISFVVNRACQYMAHPTTSHLQAAKRILRYLKGTATHGLSIHASPSWSLQGYTDADWASCPDDKRSTSGFCLFFWHQSHFMVLHQATCRLS